jgi:hypothetical protein
MKQFGITLAEGTDIGNLTVDSGDSFPGSPSLGELFYKTGTGVGLYVYNGTDWVAAGTGGGGGSSSLTSTYVGFGDGSNVLTGESAFTYDTSTNKLTITNGRIEVQRDDGNQADIWATTYGVNGGGILHGRMARGTIASPSAILAGDIFGGFGSRAYYSGGNTFQNSSPTSIHWVASENQTSTGFGSYLRILTTPKGSTTRQERVIVSDVGTLWVHDTATYDPINEVQTKPVVDSLIVATASGGGSATMTAVAYGGAPGGFRGVNIGGTSVTPTATATNSLLTFLGGHGYTGSSIPSVSSGLIKIVSTENWSATAQGSEIVFATTPNGSTAASRTDRLKITNSGNLEFLTSGQKILGDFSTSSPITNRVMFQTTTPNASAGVTILPNGSGTGAYWIASNNSSPTNSGVLVAGANVNEVQIKSDVLGSGTTIPLRFYVNNTNPGLVAEFTTTGNFNITGTARRIQGDFSNATHTNRTLFQDSVGTTSTSVGAIPATSNNGSAFVAFGNVDATNASYAQLSNYPTLGYSRIASSATGTGTVLPLAIFVGASEQARILTTGAWSFGSAGNATGTSGQVLTSAGSGSPPTWSAPSSLTTGNATNIGITDDTTTNATMYPLWVTSTSGNLPAKVSSTKLTFNPSTGLVSTTALSVSGTARVDGTLAIGGGSPQTYSKVIATGAISGNTTAWGYRADVTFQSDVTSIACGFSAQGASQATTFTLGSFQGLRVDTFNKGAGSTVNNVIGVQIADQTAGTNNYGLKSALTSGTGKWNLYCEGTALNHMNGALLIGGTTDNGYKFEVTGSARVTQTLQVDQRLGVGAAAQTYFGVFNNATLSGGSGVQYAERVSSILGTDCTVAGRGVSVALQTAAGTYTIPDTQSIRVDNPSKGAGCTVTNNYGILVTDQTAGDTGNFGVNSQLTAGTGKWNFYAGGTARNYFAGGVEVAAGTTSMTSGFSHVAAAAGTPTGAPTNPSGNVPLYFDTTGHKMYAYDGSWLEVGGGGSATGDTAANPNTLAQRDSNADLYANNFVSSSDGRLKKDIKPIIGALDKVAMLEGVTYVLKATDKASAGVIAQQIEGVLPDLVYTDPETGMKSVNYLAMIGYLIEAIKELKQEIRK